ncbi:hypothetical protein AALO_G00008730 [Alosa alosa]|uniref:Uncharacterized protein n=1 Tax=Alosa alosa TaxID=278164 RepID=A0AAV6HFA6_9TELE|nr:hypothetical protein AALO_G00008730 [Alosa alosa]
MLHTSVDHILHWGMHLLKHALCTGHSVQPLVLLASTMANTPGTQMAGPMAISGTLPRLSPFNPDTVNMKPKKRKMLHKATTIPVRGFMPSTLVIWEIYLLTPF